MRRTCTARSLILTLAIQRMTIMDEQVGADAADKDSGGLEAIPDEAEA